MSLLEAQGISKAFGGIQALDTCSISVEQGSITGLIGPNGSGKTTLFNVMTGYERVDSGQVRFQGKSITNASPARVFRLGVGRTFQLTRIFPRLTVLENMHVAVQRNDLKGLLSRWSSSHEQRRALGLLDFVGLDTTYYITHVMYDEFKERRFASPPLLKRLVLAGWYGKKTGKGFYDWSDAKNPVPVKL